MERKAKALGYDHTMLKQLSPWQRILLTNMTLYYWEVGLELLW